MFEMNRRQMLLNAATVGIGLASTRSLSAAKPKEDSMSQVSFCLNTSTISGQKLSIEQEIQLAADVGFTGIEPWIRELEEYRTSGKSLKDLRKKISDLGLRVESAIGFAQWIVDDPTVRQQGLEQMKRDMDLLSQVGGTRIAAPPFGAHEGNAAKLDLFAAAERYAQVLKLGREFGVLPMVEIWGFSSNLSRVGESAFVAIESGEADACLLPDVYHIFKGGSSFEGMRMLSGVGIPCFHFNDYPADFTREEINDRDRVYPGDGVAPFPRIVEILKSIGFNGVLSLELFNESYWKQDAKTVLQTGLSKMKNVWQQN